MKKPALFILAAGASSRMGVPKQLLSFKNNTLLGTVIQHCKAAEVDNIYCILGANAAKIETSHQNLGINFIKNDEYRNGLSSSIRKAIEFILEIDPAIPSILFLLGDQPYITEAHIRKYIKLHKEHPSKVIATAYGKGNGVPALFPNNHFSRLLQLQGDSGAKYLLETFTDKILVQLPQENLTDIDTKEEYLNSLKGYNK
ncbi:MAG: molybdenum cofactor cytidylyltransferase [Flavobacteriales bacterium]